MQFSLSTAARASLVAGLWCSALAATAQTPAVPPLGAAASFGLLTGDSLTTDAVSAVRVFGQTGVATTVRGPVWSSAGLLRPTTGSGAAVTNALNALATARAACSALSTQPLTGFTGQTLTGGAYTLTGNATLNGGTAVVLSGDTASRFVITVTGNLTLATGARVRLQGVRPDHVYWNVGGNVVAAGNTTLPGVLLAGGSVALNGLRFGTTAVLAAGALTLQNLRNQETDGSGEFYAPTTLRQMALLGTPPCAPLPVCNLVRNGDFEVMTSLVPGQPAPTQFSNINFQTGGGNGLRLSESPCWRTTNEESPESFRTGGLADLSIPANARNCNNQMYTGQHTPGVVGTGSYAGLYSYRGGDLPDPGGEPDRFAHARREYISQELDVPLEASAPGAPRDYYVEFWTLRAASSQRQLDRLGLLLSATDLYEPIGGFTTLANPARTVLGSLLGQTTPQGFYTPTVDRHEGNFNSQTVWSRTAGCHRAVGNERFLTLGCFAPDATAGFANATNNCTPAIAGAYYYLDDVLIQPFPTAGANLMACGTATLGSGCELPGSSNATYQWSGGPGLPAGATTPTVTVNLAGLPVGSTHTYTLTVTVPPADGVGAAYVSATSVTVTIGGTAFTIPGNLTLPAGTPAAPVVTTWNTNQTVHGTVTVPSGAVLVVDGAVVRFDDTRTGPIPAYPSRIRIHPGGKLRLINGAVLTSLIDDVNAPNPPTVCHNPLMWDGVTVLGTGSGANNQDDAIEGVVEIESATIANARVGLLVGKSTHGTGTHVSLVSAQGGGIVRADKANFLDCRIGVAFAPYQGTLTSNRSYFTHCEFRSSKVLDDPFYFSTTYGTRYGTQMFAQLIRVRGITFTGNTFSGYYPNPSEDVNAAIPNIDYRLRGYGIRGSNASMRVLNDDLSFASSGDEVCVGRPNLFENLYYGITNDGDLTGAELVAIGNEFRNNGGGICLATSHGSVVRYNQFAVGTPGMAFGLGLYFSGSYGTKPEGNRFWRYTVPNPVPGQTPPLPTMTRGLITMHASNNDQDAMHPLIVYRNLFGADLNIGYYARYDDHNVTFRCNNFDGPFNGSDVEVRDGKIAPKQGDCAGQNPEDRPNNLFSTSATAAQPNIRLIAGGQGFLYAHDQPPSDPRMIPDFYSSGVVLDACPLRTMDLGCESTDPLQTEQEIKDEMAALPDSTDEYKLKLDELVTALLTKEGGEHGIDSAIAVLTRYNHPAFEDKLLQLLARKSDAENGEGDGDDYGDVFGRGRRKEPAQPAAAALTAQLALPHQTAGAAVAQRAGQVNYFRRVLELLLPLNSDSARTAALATPGALRAELTAMAEDSTAWGSMAARSALNQYAGTNYRPLLLDDEPTTDELARAAAVSPTPAARPAPAAFIVLAPNPSTGHVRVGYGLPQTARVVTLRVFDEWGRPAGEHSLDDAALEAGVVLRLRSGLYHCQLVADGKVVVTERLLISR